MKLDFSVQLEHHTSTISCEPTLNYSMLHVVYDLNCSTATRAPLRCVVVKCCKIHVSINTVSVYSYTYQFALAMYELLSYAILWTKIHVQWQMASHIRSCIEYLIQLYRIRVGLFLSLYYTEIWLFLAGFGKFGLVFWVFLHRFGFVPPYIFFSWFYSQLGFIALICNCALILLRVLLRFDLCVTS